MTYVEIETLGWVTGSTAGGSLSRSGTSSLPAEFEELYDRSQKAPVAVPDSSSPPFGEPGAVHSPT